MGRRGAEPTGEELPAGRCGWWCGAGGGVRARWEGRVLRVGRRRRKKEGAGRGEKGKRRESKKKREKGRGLKERKRTKR